jgi:hypothetical protein
MNNYNYHIVGSLSKIQLDKSKKEPNWIQLTQKYKTAYFFGLVQVARLN